MLTDIPNNAFSLKLGTIRLGEFDMGGVLYHANYFHLLESCREALLEECSQPYPSLVKQGLHLAISDSTQKFLKPVLYGQELSARIWVSKLKKVGLSFNYSLHNDSNSGELVHLASTKHAVVLTRDGQFKVSKLPQNLSDKLKPYLADS